MTPLRNVITIGLMPDGTPIIYARQPDGTYSNLISESMGWTAADMVRDFCTCRENGDACPVHMPECGCVTDDQSCPTCRAQAREIYEIRR